MGSQELERLHGALVEQAREEIDVALRAAVLLALGWPRHEIAERLGIELADVKRAVRRLQKIAPKLER